MNLHKSAGNPCGKLESYDRKDTRLQELSLMNNTYFGAKHYDIHLDMNLDYTYSRIFKEISLSELETLHQLLRIRKNTNSTITRISSTKITFCRISIIWK